MQSNINAAFNQDGTISNADLQPML
jgi:hypothetical protein